MLEFKVLFRQRGESGEHPELLSAAWDELEESHVMDKQAWIQKTVSTLQGFDRYEVYAYENGAVVGGVVLAYVVDDFHVGACLTVVCNYVLPSHRSRGIGIRFLKAAEDMATMHECTTLLFSHRVGEGKYMLTYRRVRGSKHIKGTEVRNDSERTE